VYAPDAPDAPRISNLIVVSPEPEAAAALTSRLRTQRLTVGVEHVAALEDLDTHPIHEVDLVVWDARSPWPVREIVARLAARNLETPLLALVPTLDPARLVALAEDGVRDLIALDAPDHLAAIVRREMATTEIRRERRRLRETCHELRTNWETTLRTLPLPAALLLDGTHVFVNDAYRTFFHQDDIDETPFLGLFPKGERETLKKALRAAVRATSQETALELGVSDPDVAGGVTTLLLLPVVHEGTPAVLALLPRTTASAPSPQAATDAPSEKPPPPKDEAPPLETPARFVARVEEYLHSTPPKKTDQVLLMIGVDAYASLVDDYGPLVGESVLKQIEQHLVRELHPLEFATRLGRDHYAWLQRPHGEGVELFAQSLLNRLNEHVYESGEHSLRITVRAGWADRHQCRDVWSLVRAAHNAYARGGHEPVSRYVPSVAGIENPEEIAGAFRRQIEGRRLRLSLATLSPLRTDAPAYLGLLDSVPEEPLDRLPRADLFTLLKRANLLRTYDRWLVARALERCAQNAARSPGARLAVRVSGETLDDEEFLPWFDRERKGGEELLFLVSERTVAGRLRTFQSLVQKAGRCGLSFGFCDFAAGPQSAGLLRYTRPALVILRASLGSELMELANLEPEKRRTASPLGLLLETCRAENVPVAMAGDTLEGFQAASKLRLYYALSTTPEILPPTD
jgi:GGDEF domain-containing protein/EAL domain-containing protein (putative c-di-GMP-specific phosphodiesterase class I)